jgi:hypothetical protein
MMQREVEKTFRMKSKTGANPNFTPSFEPGPNGPERLDSKVDGKIAWAEGEDDVKLARL